MEVVMSADLPPDVRAEASRGVNRAMRTKQAGAAVTLEMLHAVVQAVTAVVAPEIARPLQARIEELEDRELRLQEQAGVMAEELELLRDATVVVQCDDPQHAERDALRARVTELEGEMSELIYDASIELVGLPVEARTRLSQAINEARELLAKGEKP